MKIIDNKTIVATIITFCLLIGFSVYNNKTSYALDEINTPSITSFGVQQGETGALRIEFDSNNSGYNYAYELVNTTTNKKNTLAGSAGFYVYQNLEIDKTYKVMIRVCSLSSNQYLCSNWTKKEATTSINSNNNSSTNNSSTSNQTTISSAIKVKTPTLSKLTSTSKTITLKYKTTGKVTGVEILNVTTGKKKTITNKKTYTFKDLKSNKKYKFKIRSYYKTDKKYYSDYTKVKSIKTKKSGLTSEQFLAKADSIGDYLNSHNYYYSNSGCNSTFGASKSGKKCSNCALYVSWVMQETGLLKKGQTFYVYFGKLKGKSISSIKNNNKLKVTYTNATVKTLVKKKKLVPGDIIGSKDQRHTMIYRGKSNGKYYFASAGGRGFKKGYKIKKQTFSSSHKVGIIIHPKSYDN